MSLYNSDSLRQFWGYCPSPESNIIARSRPETEERRGKVSPIDREVEGADGRKDSGGQSEGKADAPKCGGTKPRINRAGEQRRDRWQQNIISKVSVGDGCLYELS